MLNRDHSRQLAARRSHGSQRSQRSLQPRPVDSLESRRVLSAAAVPTIVDGTLYITGTPRADEISVVVGRNGRVHAVVNGTTTQFKLGKVHGVVVDAGGGADRVGVSLAVPATLMGGTGNDVLVSGDGNDFLSGGLDADQLFAGSGTNRTEGGEGVPTTDPVINRVEFDDLLKLAASYNSPGSQWNGGDFHYDSSVQFDDLLKLASNYNQQLNGGEWGLAQQTSSTPAAPSLSADVSQAAAVQRMALVVSDKYVVRSQTDVGNRRMRVEFATASSPSTTAFSIVMRTKSLIVLAAQADLAHIVGFDSRTLAKKLPATGTAFVVGKSKAIRLTGKLTDLPGQNAVSLRAAGGSIVVSRNSEEGATFVAA